MGKTRGQASLVWLQALVWMKAPAGWPPVPTSPRQVLAAWASLKATLEAAKLR